MNTYLYLHGFASSPQSRKAQFLQQCFQQHHIDLTIPDLNQPDFTSLTLTRQLQQIQTLIRTHMPHTAITLIGSSFGGLTAALLAEHELNIQRLVLLAPAFQFLVHWMPSLGAQQMRQWRADGYLQVYHYNTETYLPLSYEFIRDAMRYDDTILQRSLPTLILHGRQDDVIPVQASRDYAEVRPWVTLIELDSDHGLVTAQTQIWSAIQDFCQLQHP